MEYIGIIDTGNDFLNRIPMVQQLTEHINKCDYMNFKSFFVHSKRNGHLIEEET
jgi:hypothetical protein